MTDTTPPTIIAFASPKGGAGKSTTCLAIAGALLSKGYSVHIIDFDQSQTLWRWYTEKAAPTATTNLTVQLPPKENLSDFAKGLWSHPADFVLIDLAGQLTREMLHLAVFATLTITPVQLSEPDIVEANRIHDQLLDIQTRVHKPIIHRLLVNNVQPLRGAFENALLDELIQAQLPRFNRLIFHRAAYKEIFGTGLPPHFADQTRPAITKAVDELDALFAEIETALTDEDTAIQPPKKEAA
ncbi:division plane positioning ATPase MipZ [Hyphomicrobium sp. DY-1]|uniref:division plane positioning ATPase MipZ n=1 Tax=Hyphomicrobium sp. DY-1 TaxID=3075650 RepID=UPI0039C3EEA4